MPEPTRSADSLFAPHERGGRFFCPWGVARRSALDLLRWQLRRTPARERRPRAAIQIEPNDGASLAAVAERAELTWIGHGSFALHEGERCVVVDPHFGARALLPRRHSPPGLPLAAIPANATALLTHNHYDHLDDGTLARLPRSIDWLVPWSLEEHLRGAGFDRVRQLDWWGEAELGGWRFTFLPAQHWSRRWGEPENATLWGGWLVDTGRTRVFFAGDTGWFHGFAEFGRRFAPLDLAVLPIGAYAQRWFMQPMHLDPEEALRAARDLGARLWVPGHWGAFDLSDEAVDEPPRALARELARAAHADLAPRTRLLAVGETLRL